MREREQRAAAEVLGVKSVTFLGEVDGTFEVNLDTRRKVCREVRRLRPEVIVAPDPSRLWYGSEYVNHWDHKQAGLLALTVVMPDAPTRPMFPELLDEGLEPFEVPNLWLATARRRHLHRHLRLDRHQDRGAQRPTYPRAPADAEPRIRERAEAVAALSEKGYGYAEGFKALRFVDDEEREPAR